MLLASDSTTLGYLLALNDHVLMALPQTSEEFYGHFGAGKDAWCAQYKDVAAYERAGARDRLQRDIVKAAPVTRAILLYAQGAVTAYKLDMLRITLGALEGNERAKTVLKALKDCCKEEITSLLERQYRTANLNVQVTTMLVAARERLKATFQNSSCN